MLRNALNEIRLHPGRFVATLIAIAISVGFISAVSVFVNSEATAMGKVTSLTISKADVVVKGYGEGDLTETLRAVPGVSDVYAPGAGGLLPLTKGERSAYVQLFQTPPEEFRWAAIVEGRYPTAPDEVALSRDGLSRLDAKVGDELTVDGMPKALRVVGVTDDPKTMFAVTGYFMNAAGEPGSLNGYSLKVKGASPEQVADAVRAALPKGTELTVETGAAARQKALDNLTGGFDVFKSLLQAFGVVALLVGMITIANTFTILVTQRRRQTGLLRAVGASTGQVMGRLVVESFLLGAIGSIIGILLGIGVAAIGGSITGSLHWGLTIKPMELLIAFAAGVLATMIAAIAPALTAARVKPLEALQVVPTEAQARRAGAVRIAVCSVFVVLGAALVVLSRMNPEWGLLWAIGAGVCLTIAVLGGAVLYVPPLLRLAAKAFGFAGPTTRLALTNAARNPRRAAATASALMLAVGLIVTLQVALATARSSGTVAIEREYPIDIAVDFWEQPPASFQDQLAATPGVAKVVPLQTKEVQAGDSKVKLRTTQDAYQQLGLQPPADKMPDDGTVLVSDFGSNLGVKGDKVSIPTADGMLQLTVKTTRDLSADDGIVSPAVFAKVAGEPSAQQFWVKLTDRADTTIVNRVVKLVEGKGAHLQASGAMMASVLNQVLDIMLIVLTALLGVAVLIALVGVGNTLGLSVLERQRESALLRALGMQRAGLRTMLLIEAIALVAVGVVIGLLAGMFFGWLGVSSTIAMIPSGDIRLRFALDPLYTTGLILVCLVAAVLASILPGRRAANATPTEALAVE